MKSILVILHAFWVGAQISIGYWVTPLLFHFAKIGVISNTVAGNIAGELFEVLMYLGLVMSCIWWWLGKKWRISTVLIKWIMAALLINTLLITPVIQALKTEKSHWLLEWVGGSFGMWHGISSIIYLFITLILLVWTWQRLQINMK